MKRRALGRSGIEVAPLVLGGNVFGWTVDEAASHRLLDAFVAGGFNAIDTADVYSRWIPGHKGGESETVIGSWLRARGQRDRVVIATKCGMDMGGDHKGLSKRWIAEAVEASLRRLGTDYIDLYQAHADDASTPLEETLGAYAELVRGGKVRAIGASNYTAARLRAALETSERLGLPRYETLQPHYNLVERTGFEQELAALCRERAVGVIPYFGLASGFLTGKYRSAADLGKSPRGGGMKKLLEGRGPRILAALDDVAKLRGATPAQVALAWLMAKIEAPIASATSVEQLNELMGAARVSLASADVAALDRASS